MLTLEEQKWEKGYFPTERETDTRRQQKMKHRVVCKFYRDNIEAMTVSDSYWNVKPETFLLGPNSRALVHFAKLQNKEEIDKAFQEAAQEIMARPYRRGYTKKQCLEDLEDHPALQQFMGMITGEVIAETVINLPGETNKTTNYIFRKMVITPLVRTFGRYYRRIDKEEYGELYEECLYAMRVHNPNIDGDEALKLLDIGLHLECKKSSATKEANQEIVAKIIQLVENKVSE